MTPLLEFDLDDEVIQTRFNRDYVGVVENTGGPTTSNIFLIWKGTLRLRLHRSEKFFAFLNKERKEN